MTIDFVDRLLQFDGRDLGVIAGKFRSLYPLQQTGSQGVGVPFNQADEPVRKHHDHFLLLSVSAHPAA